VEFQGEATQRKEEGPMKNQSFHPRKIRIQEVPELDYEQLKSRTTIALKRLGEQKFSNEPGGYSLDNWAKGVNILLNDFEEKMGEGRLTSEYLARRRELNNLLSNPISTSSIDRDISEIRHEIADANDRIEAERVRIASSIAELKREQVRSSADLAQERDRISNLTEERSSGSFFRRLIAGDSKTQRDSRGLVEDLESKLDALNTEMLEQQRLLKSVQQRSPESPSAEEWKVLESLQTRLEALESERLENVQLVKVREVVTASIADAISKMSI
jgi:hypothetical protein